MINLTIEDGEGQVLSVPFVRQEISIGRKEGNTIRLTERNISRYHAILTRDGNSVFIEDLDSYNGVVLNGTKIARKTEVTDEDLVQIGDYSITVEIVHEHVSQKVQLDQSLLEEARRVMSEPSESGEMDLATTVSSPEALGVGRDPRLRTAHDDDPQIGSYPTLESIPVASSEPTLQAAPEENAEPSAKEAPQPIVEEEAPAAAPQQAQEPTPTESGQAALPPGLDQSGVGGGMRHQDEAFVEQAINQSLADADFDNENDEEFSSATEMSTATKAILALLLLAVVAAGIWWVTQDKTPTDTLTEPALVPAPMDEGEQKLAEQDESEEDKLAREEADRQLMRHLEAQRKEAQERLAKLNEKEQEKLTELIDTNMDKAENAIRKQKWRKAEVALNSILERMPDFEAAVAVRDKVRKEKNNEDLYKQGCRQLAAKGYLEASITLASIGDDSYYTRQAQRKTKQAKALAVKRFVRQGIGSLKKRDFDSALDKANRALTIEPDHEMAKKLKEKAQARDAEWHPKRRNNGSSSSQRFNRSNEEAQAEQQAAAPTTPASGEDEQAEEQAREPQTADDFFNQGMELFNAGQFSKAIRSFQKATRKDRSHAASYLAMGSSYASLQKPDKALLAYQRFLKLAPNHPQAAQIRQFVEDYKRSMQQ